ncbi:Uu.00g038180.m01.CDS01 [Anthostomella pinea]|uniref:Uu.00g038180.m01.CDS01 n=1 Tax=Anthostomella pinea TaxID=933095 RepID=A0AAI8VAR7_9PEZI|nr:Uu.00g038180.m01.CDS01 [Anthostomella pinea]
MGSLRPLLPYWQMNVPEDERTEECPDYLSNLSAKDVGIIGTPDAECHVATWPEVQKLVAENRLDQFQRLPSELRRYLGFSWELKQDYGSVMNFMLTQRLQWTAPVWPRGRPFEFGDDVKILWNDWPYGIDERIVHLVVWTKFDLEEDPITDDLTDKARAEIDDYVQKTFGSSLPKDHFVWFKNWRSLKSVQAVEHFHVMLFDPDPAFIDEVTGGDVPLCRKV